MEIDTNNIKKRTEQHNASKAKETKFYMSILKPVLVDRRKGSKKTRTAEDIQPDQLNTKPDYHDQNKNRLQTVGCLVIKVIDCHSQLCVYMHNASQLMSVKDLGHALP